MNNYISDNNRSLFEECFGSYLTKKSQSHCSSESVEKTVISEALKAEQTITPGNFPLFTRSVSQEASPETLRQTRVFQQALPVNSEIKPVQNPYCSPGQYWLLEKNKEIIALLNQGELAAAEKILLEVENGLEKPNLNIYQPFLTHYARYALESGFLKCLERMKKFNISIDKYCLNSKLNLYANLNEQSKFAETLQEMTEAGVELSAVTYNIILKHYQKLDDKVKFAQTIDCMKRDKIEFNQIIYNTILSFYESCKNWVEVEKCFQEMKSLQLSLSKISENIYVAMIKQSIQRGDEQKALDLMATFQTQEGHQSETILTLMTYFYINQKNLPKVNEYFEQLAQTCFPVKTNIFNSLLDFFSKENQPSEMMKLWDRKEKLGVVVDVQSYNYIIIQTSNKIDKNNRNCPMISLTEALFESMEKTGIQKDLCNWNLLIKFQAYIGNSSQAIAHFNEMKNHVVPSVRTYTQMMYLYSGEQKYIHHARALLDEVISTQGAFLEKIYNPLFNYELKNQNIESIEKTFAKFNSMEIKIEGYWMNRFMNLLVKLEKFTLAEKIFTTYSSQTQAPSLPNSIDLHEKSYGAGYIQMRCAIAKMQKGQSLTVITGYGLHGKNPIFAMQKNMIEKLKQYHPEISWRYHPHNKGQMIITKKT